MEAPNEPMPLEDLALIATQPPLPAIHPPPGVVLLRAAPALACASAARLANGSAWPSGPTLPIASSQ